MGAALCYCLLLCFGFVCNSNVLHVCWLTKTMTEKIACNTAEGLCAAGSVRRLKP